MRGYQKKIIFLKNTGSSLFEEAYFVLKNEGEGNSSHATLVKEANRIIEENFARKKSFKKIFNLRNLTAFCLGSAVAFVVCFAMFSLRF